MFCVVKTDPVKMLGTNLNSFVITDYSYKDSNVISLCSKNEVNKRTHKLNFLQVVVKVNLWNVRKQCE